MNWLILASNKKFPVRLGDGIRNLSSDQFANFIKSKLARSKVVGKMFAEFGMELRELRELAIVVDGDLDDEYGLTDGSVMRLSKEIFDGGYFDWDVHSFIVVHELFHYLERNSSEPNQNLNVEGRYDFDDSFFRDKEESRAFVFSAAFLIEEGCNAQQLQEKMYDSAIEFHFDSDGDAQRFFQNLIEEAIDFIHK